MKNAVIAALVVALVASIAAGVIARVTRTVNVEVRVWQDVDQPDSLWLSARPDGGSWADLGTIPVPLDGGLSGTGRYRYGDVVIALAVPPPPSCADASLAADCAVLLAARDALAGDGALNWSADVPLTEWDGVTVSGTPRRVMGLDLRHRGLTGTIPPELGSLPPTLTTVYLGGNAFTGCVPERLRLAENDLEALMAERTLGHCPVPEVPWDGEALSPGTYHLGGWIIVDIPASDFQVGLCGLAHQDFAYPEDMPEGQSSDAVCFGDIDERWEMWLDYYYAVEWNRYSTDQDADDQALPAEVDAVFDAIAATARRMPPPSCAEEALAPDCSILLVARDVLAGDGALNWSPDVPVEEWDGVSVSRSSRRVTWLSVVNRGLTGRIPPEMGNLTALRGLALSGNSLAGSVPPDLEKLLPSLGHLQLSGNSFTGCVPERLRRVPNDLAKLQGEIGFSWCPVAEAPHGVALAAGTYLIEGGIIIDIPADGPRVQRTWTVDVDTEDGGVGSECLSDLADIEWICLGPDGKEVSRGPSAGGLAIVDSATVPAGLDAVFDAIAATARPAPPSPPSCEQPSLAADCAVLLAARDALAGDGVLNWSADIPITRWDGVALSGTPWLVTGLDLRDLGLTGTIPPELESLLPTLVTLYLAGNDFTGCIPERLRLTVSDLVWLSIHGPAWGSTYCPVPDIPHGVALTAGTYQVGGRLIVDIPEGSPKVKLNVLLLDSEGEAGGRNAYYFSDINGQWEMCLNVFTRVEWGCGVRHGSSADKADRTGAGNPPPEIEAVFDQIAATARHVHPPPQFCTFPSQSSIIDCEQPYEQP